MKKKLLYAALSFGLLFEGATCASPAAVAQLEANAGIKAFGLAKERDQAVEELGREMEKGAQLRIDVEEARKNERLIPLVFSSIDASERAASAAQEILGAYGNKDLANVVEARILLEQIRALQPIVNEGGNLADVIGTREGMRARLQVIIAELRAREQEWDQEIKGAARKVIEEEEELRQVEPETTNPPQTRFGRPRLAPTTRMPGGQIDPSTLRPDQRPNLRTRR